MTEKQTLGERLAAPITDYKWRLQQTQPKGLKPPYPAGTRGLFMAYIDARDLYDRLDEVFGVGGWSRAIKAVNPDGSVIAQLVIKIGDEYVTHEDIGYPNSPGASFETEPLKAAASDGFKRAGVGLGIGRFLYEVDARWMDVDQWGKPVQDQRNRAPAPEHNEQAENAPRARTTSQNTIPAHSLSGEASANDVSWTAFWNEARAAGLNSWPMITERTGLQQEASRTADEAISRLRDWVNSQPAGQAELVASGDKGARYREGL